MIMSRPETYDDAFPMSDSLSHVCDTNYPKSAAVSAPAVRSWGNALKFARANYNTVEGLPHVTRRCRGPLCSRSRDLRAANTSHGRFQMQDRLR